MPQRAASHYSKEFNNFTDILLQNNAIQKKKTRSVKTVVEKLRQQKIKHEDV
jgi:hypothetical protein